MSEQLSSDTLSKLRGFATHPVFRMHGYVSVRPDTLLALLDCVEMMQETQRHGTHFLGDQWFARRDKLLTKLEAL